MKLSTQQLHILQHSLGVDEYGQGNQYRNRFVTGPGSTDWDNCRALTDAGLMFDHGPLAICGGDHCFCVTESGVEAVKAQSQKPPKISHGRRRYLEFLDADSGMKFIDWLKSRKHLQQQLTRDL